MFRRLFVGGKWHGRCSAALAKTGSDRASSSYSLKSVAAVGVAGTLVGSAVGGDRLSLYAPAQKTTCSVAPLSNAQKGLAESLRGIVGKKYVTENKKQKGSRLGQGTSLAYVQPGNMKEAVDVLQACVKADVAVIPQGANTALTGGSVPRAEIDRPVVVLNLRRLNKMLPIGPESKQVLCFAGAGIFDLKTMLAEKHGRDSHSVLGSIFLNPSVAAGVCFGSGGTQIRKGPSWTERALYAKVKADGNVELVNTLGLKDGGDVCSFLESKDSLSTEDVDPNSTGHASWPNYAENVRKLTPEVSRYNADCTGLECCRSEGKVMILATIHDTFEQPKTKKLIWASCKNLQTAHEMKAEVCLQSADTMSATCEYMNKEVFQGVDRAGRILIFMIRLIGMQRLEPLWNLKLMIETIPLPYTNIISDKLLYWFNGIIPQQLPAPLKALGDKYDHHCLMEFSEYSEGECDRLLKSLEKFVKSKPEGEVSYHVCETAKEQERATLYRFVVAPAFRTFAVGRGLQGFSIDFALPKNYTDCPPIPEKKYPVKNRWIYSHFGCNVYHEDYTFGAEVDMHGLEEDFQASIQTTGGRAPAEHGHGKEYPASADMQERWKKTDPLNIMNPGVGGTSPLKLYA